MGLNQTTLTNNKILKFITLYSNILLKDIIKKIFFIFKLLVLPLFNFLIFIMNFIINLFFNKIIKIKIFRVKIQDIFYKILYLKQFLVFKKLLNKRKHSVDPRLRKIKIKLIRKENFKKLFIKHIERKRKIKLIYQDNGGL